MRLKPKVTLLPPPPQYIVKIQSRLRDLLNETECLICRPQTLILRSQLTTNDPQLLGPYYMPGMVLGAPEAPVHSFSIPQEAGPILCPIF